MGTEFKNIQIDGNKVIFVRDFQFNPIAEQFSETDALCLATCPNLLEAAERARADSYEDKFCNKCGKTSVKWISAISTYQVSGKCPQL